MNENFSGFYIWKWNYCDGNGIQLWFYYVLLNIFIQCTSGHHQCVRDFLLYIFANLWDFLVFCLPASSVENLLKSSRFYFYVFFSYSSSLPSRKVRKIFDSFCLIHNHLRIFDSTATTLDETLTSYLNYCTRVNIAVSLLEISSRSNPSCLKLLDQYFSCK